MFVIHGVIVDPITSNADNESLAFNYYFTITIPFESRSSSSTPFSQLLYLIAHCHHAGLSQLNIITSHQNEIYAYM